MLNLLLVLLLLLRSSPSTGAECSLENDPVTLLSCVAIDAVGLVEATKGNLRVFCTMAERFMECVKTKTRGCFAEDFIRGSLTELIDLSQQCCVNKGEKVSNECPFLHRPQCFSLTDVAETPNGTLIPIGELREGMEVLAMDANERIIQTEILSILHYETKSEALFYTFLTDTDDRISVTADHLLYIGKGTYLPAHLIDPSNHSLYFVSPSDRSLHRTSIRSINLEFRPGYSTPLTNEGTLLVNRISASCYSSIYDHQLGNMAMLPLRWIFRVKKFLFSSKPIEGIHWYPRLLNNALQLFPSLSTRWTTIRDFL